MVLSITLIIIIITVAVSLYANSNPELYNKLVFNPYQVVHRKEWYRVFTHAFIHDQNNILHLIFNMYVLYSFGNAVESILLNQLQGLGILYYLFIYIGGIAIATLPAIIKHKDNYNYNSVGASGAVSAVLFSTIAFVPFSGGIGIMFIPISIPPLVFGVLYIAYEMYMQKKGGTNIAHDAHIWGAIFGFVFTLLFVPGAFSNFVMQLLSAVN
ncbi:MAG: rhomboid family intramembrane serine protease [Flavobacteriales bacterium CG_4_10_14_0_2_um_filter_32_8]|nr:MAG: rhomboid family intramembrane serine protease [Flavobacteriales bacterium CG_4_10_14_0_2_um_filter_32_8]PJB15957.1 MAG: rhomboid family intramembrane serine protease [Flavobacteriales bacterium CG_4_9_14_3_um_filter_32_8]